MKIDCFIMNPPYNSGDGGACIKKAVLGGYTKLCSNIMKSLDKHRVVCISNYAGTSSVLTKITQIERQKFPDILCHTFIWTMNDNKPVLFPEIHKLKYVKKSDYFFLKMSSAPIYYLRKTNKSKYKSKNNRLYIDIANDTEMEEINKLIRDNWEPYKVFVPGLAFRSWIVANILYNSKWKDRFVK